jgi:hypothetical protein
VTEDAKAQVLRAEKRCDWYREMIAEGQHWCRVPCEITQQWIVFLRRDDVSGAEASEFVRRCDEHQRSDFDPGFFAMCDTIHRWYRAIYEAEFEQTFRKTNDANAG